VQAVQAKRSDTVGEGIGPTQLQLVAPYPTNGSGFPASFAEIHIGSWQTVELRLPAGVTAGKLEVCPVNRPAVIEVSEISIHSGAGEILWMAKTVPDLQRVQTAGTISLLPVKDRCLFFSFGSEPLWVLSPLEERNSSARLRIVLYIHTDFEAVSETINTAHAQIYLMAAQVRSAFADRNRTLREFKRRVEEAEQEQVRCVAEAQEENDKLVLQLEELQADHEKLRQQLLHMEGSRSWRMTRALRSASTLARKFRKNLD